MNNLDFGDIGARVAAYRKMNGWSGDDLVERAGHGISRAVLANIETGRKRDLSVVHLFALARALQVPPAVLLFDVTKPFEPTTLKRNADGSGDDYMTVWMALEWMSGQNIGGLPDESLPSMDAFLIVDEVREYIRATGEVRDIEVEVVRLDVLLEAGKLPSGLKSWRDYQKDLYDKGIVDLRARYAKLLEFGVEVPERWEP